MSKKRIKAKQNRTIDYKKLLVIFLFSIVAGYLINLALPVANVSIVESMPLMTITGTVTQDDYGNYLFFPIENPDNYYYLAGVAADPQFVDQEVELTGFGGIYDGDTPYIQTTSVLSQETNEHE